MHKNGKGGGGSAHDRAVREAANRSQEAPPQVLVFSPPQSEPQQPTVLDRLFLFLENGIVLAVMGIVGSLAGVFIDGRWFLVLIIPTLLGLHRSLALKGFGIRTAFSVHAAVALLSGMLLWVLGIGVNRSREHIPTAQEIASQVSNLMSPRHKPAPADPIYPAPKGNSVRMEGTALAPSNQLCQGMSDEDQIKCLCPSPLNYTLRALPSPTDNNYATEIEIKESERPIYRARIFARTIVDARHGFIPDPKDEHSSSFVETFEYDPYSFVVSSTAPKKGFRIEVHSSEGLRLKCINQDN